MQEKGGESTDISERISQLIDYLDVNPNQFALNLGYNRSQTVYDILKGKSAPSFDFFKRLANSEYSECVNINWLLSGVGEEFKTKSIENVTFPNGDIVGDKLGDNQKAQKMSPFDTPVGQVAIDKIFKLRTDRIIDRQQIPIYDMEAVAGLVPLFANSFSQQVVEVMETTLIPKCDGGLRIVGDSMYPLLKSGDVVFYKQVHDILNNLFFGEMYLVSIDSDGEEYVVVKFINKSEENDHIMLVSHNAHHAPLDVHISRIRALALIKASLRVNSLK